MLLSSFYFKYRKKVLVLYIKSKPKGRLSLVRSATKFFSDSFSSWSLMPFKGNVDFQTEIFMKLKLTSLFTLQMTASCCSSLLSMYKLLHKTIKISKNLEWMVFIYTRTENKAPQFLTPIRHFFYPLRFAAIEQCFFMFLSTIVIYFFYYWAP